jgi:hypothetical protein
VYNIDVTQISLFNKDTNSDMQRLIDFDEDNNIYILDSFESTISVFNEQGKLVRTFGRAGQGPKEFLRPNRIIVNKNNVYVFQGLHEYKIVDLEGSYISSHLINIENRLKTRIVNDSFYLLRGKVDQTFTKLEFILSKSNIDFSSSEELFRHNYIPGFQEKLLKITGIRTIKILLIFLITKENGCTLINLNCFRDIVSITMEEYIEFYL